MLNCMDYGPIQPGTQSTLNGMRPTLRSSEESKFLWLLIQEVKRLNGSLHNVFTSAPAAFTVGTTTGAPTNGASSWTITTINVIGKNPVFLLNGTPKAAGVDYTFNNATGIMTLSTSTFATSQVWTVIY